MFSFASFPLSFGEGLGVFIFQLTLVFMPYTKKPGWITSEFEVYKHLKEFAKDNRAKATEAESLLWAHLRNAKLGCNFRRQHPISNYIVDFVCLTKRIIVEVDGDIHNFQKNYDLQRDRELKLEGFKVLRFTNEQVLNNISGVINTITNAMK